MGASFPRVESPPQPPVKKRCQTKSPSAVVGMLAVILFLLVQSVMPLAGLMEDGFCRKLYNTQLRRQAGGGRLERFGPLLGCRLLFRER